MYGLNTKNLEAARAKHADEWAKAGFFRRFRLRYKIWREANSQKKVHKPSPGILW